MFWCSLCSLAWWPHIALVSLHLPISSWSSSMMVWKITNTCHSVLCQPRQGPVLYGASAYLQHDEIWGARCWCLFEWSKRSLTSNPGNREVGHDDMGSTKNSSLRSKQLCCLLEIQRCLTALIEFRIYSSTYQIDKSDLCMRGNNLDKYI